MRKWRQMRSLCVSTPQFTISFPYTFLYLKRGMSQKPLKKQWQSLALSRLNSRKQSLTAAMIKLWTSSTNAQTSVRKREFPFKRLSTRSQPWFMRRNRMSRWLVKRTKMPRIRPMDPRSRETRRAHNSMSRGMSTMNRHSSQQGVNSGGDAGLRSPICLQELTGSKWREIIRKWRSSYRREVKTFPL